MRKEKAAYHIKFRCVSTLPPDREPSPARSGHEGEEATEAAAPNPIPTRCEPRTARDPFALGAFGSKLHCRSAPIKVSGRSVAYQSICRAEIGGACGRARG